MKKIVILVMTSLCLTLLFTTMPVQGTFLLYSTSNHSVNIDPNNTIVDIDPEEFDWQNMTGVVILLKIPLNKSMLSTDLSIDLITINQTKTIYLHETDGNTTTVVTGSGWHQIKMQFPEGNTTMEIWYGDELVWNFYYTIKNIPIVEQTPESQQAKNYTAKQDMAQDQGMTEQEENITRLKEENMVSMNYHIFDSFFGMGMTLFAVLLGVGFGMLARENVVRESHSISRNPMLRIIVFVGLVIIILYICLLVLPTVLNVVNYQQANKIISSLDIPEAKKQVYREQIREMFPAQWNVVMNRFLDSVRYVLWGVMFIGSAVFSYRRIKIQHLLRNIVEFNIDTTMYDVEGETNIGILRKDEQRGFYRFINVRDNSVKTALLQLLKLDRGLPVVFIGGRLDKIKMKFDGVEAIAVDKLVISNLEDKEVQAQMLKMRATLRKKKRKEFKSAWKRLREAFAKKIGIFEEKPPEQVIKAYLASIHSKGYRVIVDARMMDSVDAVMEEAKRVILESSSIENTGETKEFSMLITSVLSPIARVTADRNKRRELEKSMEMLNRVNRGMRDIQKKVQSGNDEIEDGLDE